MMLLIPNKTCKNNAERKNITIGFVFSDQIFTDKNNESYKKNPLIKELYSKKFKPKVLKPKKGKGSFKRIKK